MKIYVSGQRPRSFEHLYIVPTSTLTCCLQTTHNRVSSGSCGRHYIDEAPSRGGLVQKMIFFVSRIADAMILKVDIPKFQSSEGGGYVIERDKALPEQKEAGLRDCDFDMVQRLVSRKRRSSRDPLACATGLLFWRYLKKLSYNCSACPPSLVCLPS